MYINKKDLERLFQIISAYKEKEKIEEYNIVFSAPWENKYFLALDCLREFKIKLNAVISEDLEANYKDIITKFLNWNKIIFFKEVNLEDMAEIKTLFLNINRNSLVDIALLREGDFESKLVSKLLQKGTKILLWKCSVERFKKGENSYYRKKLLSYYDEISKMGVDIVDLEVVSQE